MDSPVNLMMVNGIMLFDEPLETSTGSAPCWRSAWWSSPAFRQRIVKPARRRASALGDRPGFRPRPPPHTRAAGGARRPEAPCRTLVSGHLSTALDPNGTRCGSSTSSRATRAEPRWSAASTTAIGDGIALMMVLLSLTDRTPESQPSRIRSSLSFAMGTAIWTRVREAGR